MPVDQGPQRDPRLTFAATLPVKVPPRFGAMELLAAVCDLLDGTGVTATIDPELTAIEEDVGGSRFFGRPRAAPRIALNVNSVTVTVTGHDKPGLSPAELDRLDFGDWANGKERMARSRAHLILRELDGGASADLDLNYDRATALTVVATAINRLIGTIGMVWHTSDQVMSGELMPQMFKDLLDGTAPVQVWIARLPLPNGAKGVATRGFYSLLGAEIAVLSKQLSLSESGQAANVLAAEILRSGEAPSHGEKLHYDGGVRFVVEHRAVGIDGSVPVVVLADITNALGTAPSAGAPRGDLSARNAGPSAVDEASQPIFADAEESRPAVAEVTKTGPAEPVGPEQASPTAAKADETRPVDPEGASATAAGSASGSAPEGAEEETHADSEETQGRGNGPVAASGGI